MVPELMLPSSPLFMCQAFYMQLLFSWNDLESVDLNKSNIMVHVVQCQSVKPKFVSEAVSENLTVNESHDQMQLTYGLGQQLPWQHARKHTHLPLQI